MPQWPLQSDRNKFYGNPMGKVGHVSPKWEAANIVDYKPPFKMTYAGKTVKTIRVHRKCVDSLDRILKALAGNGQATLNKWGVSIYGGCFNYRLSRNSNNLSSHSWGCAIDLAPNQFPNGQSEKRFNAVVVKAFVNEGWINLKNDPMHFQAARLG